MQGVLLFVESFPSKIASGPTGKAGGKISLKGGNLPEGTVVTFLSKEGYIASGNSGSDGSFKLTFEGGDSIPVGTYKVQLSPAAGAGGDVPSDPSKPIPETPPLPFPVKYTASSTSGLQFEIKEGENPPINIELQ
jgi:hypothetical protein